MRWNVLNNYLVFFPCPFRPIDNILNRKAPLKKNPETLVWMKLVSVIFVTIRCVYNPVKPIGNSILFPIGARVDSPQYKWCLTKPLPKPVRSPEKPLVPFPSAFYPLLLRKCCQVLIKLPTLQHRCVVAIVIGLQ